MATRLSKNTVDPWLSVPASQQVWPHKYTRSVQQVFRSGQLQINQAQHRINISLKSSQMIHNVRTRLQKLVPTII